MQGAPPLRCGVRRKGARGGGRRRSRQPAAAPVAASTVSHVSGPAQHQPGGSPPSQLPRVVHLKGGASRHLRRTAHRPGPVPPGTAQRPVAERRDRPPHRPDVLREGRCALCLHCAAGTRGQVCPSGRCGEQHPDGVRPRSVDKCPRALTAPPGTAQRPVAERRDRPPHRPGPVPPGTPRHIVPVSFGRAGVRSACTVPHTVPVSCREAHVGRCVLPGGQVCGAAQVSRAANEVPVGLRERPGALPGILTGLIRDQGGVGKRPCVSLDEPAAFSPPSAGARRSPLAGNWGRDEKSLVPERNSSLLQARGFFITLLDRHPETMEQTLYERLN